MKGAQMDNEVLKYMAMGYNIHPDGRVTDPYSHAEVDKLDLAGVSIPCLQAEVTKFVTL